MAPAINNQRSNSNNSYKKNSAVTPPDLTWSREGIPIAQQFDDPYFSLLNGLEEAKYVFLQHSQLPQRWHNWSGEFRIIETGFGCGVNFLATWQAFNDCQSQAIQSNQPSQHTWLHFTSIEKYPLSAEQLAQALALWPSLGNLREQLLQQYPPLNRGFHTLSWPQQRVTLTLIFADISEALPQLNGPVHAWFLDGFSPAKNPDMWNDTLFQQIRRISRQARLDKSDPNHTRMPTVATYAATSAIKRGLCGAGFTLQKTTGFGRKREMTCGRYSLQAGPEINPRAEQRPWLRMPNSMKVPNSLNNHRSVAIIGAGLAGCTSARSLAERGYHIILLDKDGIAQGASGNPQGGLYIKSAVDDNATHSDFYRQAYLYALQRVDSLTSSEGWQACGVLQLAFNEKERQRQQRFLQSQQPPEDFVRGINITQSDAWCDVMQSDDQLAQTNASVEDTSFGGLFYPKAGWVSLVDFCKALIDHPNIHFKQTRVEKLQQTPTSITLECRSGEIPATASSSHSIECSQVVIATAWQTKELLPDAYLPIKSIRGQLTYLDAQTVPPLSTVLCAKSYVPPPQDGRLLIGATYHINDSDTSLRAQDHDTNIENLRQFGAAWSNAADHAKVIGGRVGFRCTTPDYLPIVGPVCDTQATLKSLKPMAKNAHQIPVADMPWQPGIWLNIGHGSRGLVSAPFSAELLTSMMTGNTVSCSSKAMEALLPCRFLIRDMIRRKVTAADD